MGGAYYNEIDAKKAAWLRALIAAGLIAPGDVDERSIVDVQPDDLQGYTQCHFFAGIGIWSYALRRAGWADDRPVWTGSCPCQPFSDAGAKAGFADHRHLWPEWFRLIRVGRPRAVFGEQVASKDALAWLDHVSADLEGAGYAIGAVDTCAAGFGAPHIRQRLFYVAHAADGDGRRGECGAEAGARPHGEWGRGSSGGGAAGELGHASSRGCRERGDAPLAGGSGHADGPVFDGVAQGDAIGAGLEGLAGHGDDGHEPGRLGALAAGSVAAASANDLLADPDERGRPIERAPRLHADGQPGHDAAGCGPVNGFWSGAEWIECRDGKARPVEPGSSPLAHGTPARVVRLRGYGDGIVAPVAEEFIRAYMSL